MTEAVISPVGWYAVTYLEMFVPLKSVDQEPLGRVHENTVIVQASDAEEAYDRCHERMSRVLTGGEYVNEDCPDILFTSVFLGIVSIHVMVEVPADMSEVMSVQYDSNRVSLKRRLKPREEVVFHADTFGGVDGFEA